MDPMISTGDPNNVKPVFNSVESQEPAVGISDTVLGFIDDRKPSRVTLGKTPEGTNSNATYVDSSLSEFFSRPIKLDAFDWNLGFTASQTYDVFDMYFSQPSVKAKLSNYQLLSATMHFRVIINATNFHYGRLYASALPLPGLNPGHDPDAKGDNEGRLFKTTMFPHTSVDVKDNSSAEMDLPFIFPLNYIDIDDINSKAVGKIPWRVYITSSGNLKAASATATDAATVTVLAWATDVELSVSTVRTQSENLENTKKIIRWADNTRGFIEDVGAITRKEEDTHKFSSLATTASDILEPLIAVPVIGKFAAAGATVLNGLGKVAAFFGFARPPVITDPQYIKTRPFTSTANMYGSETVDKLTMDPHQGVDVLPSVVGTLGVDEMSLRYVRNIDPVFTQFNISSVDNVDDEVFWTNVSPTQLFIQDVGGVDAYYLSPLTASCIPFQFWKGTLVYRFQVIASSYHNARIRVAYEPSGLDTNDEYNLSHALILDINQVRDFEVHIPWAQDTPYKNLPNFNNLVPSYTPNTKSYNITNNGRLSISMVNKLTSPDGASDIDVLVSCRAGSDFVTSAPIGSKLSQFTYAPVSVVEQASGNHQAPASFHLFGESDRVADVNEINKQHFGENCVSYRAMMKRYAKLDSIVIDGASTTNHYETVIYGKPIPTGLSSLAVNDDGSEIFNYHHLSIHEFIKNQYLFERGAWRFKYAFNSEGKIGTMHILRANDETANVQEGTTTVSTAGSSLDYNLATFANTDSAMYNGALVSTGEIQNTFEVEFPYYNKFKFFPSTTEAIRQSTDPNYLKRCYMSGTFLGLASDHCIVDRYVSTGEDYSCYGYVGPAVMFARNY